MKVYKIVRKIAAYFSIAILGLITAGVILSMYFKDEVVQFFVNETNKYLTTPIEVEKIELSPFTHFPRVSINLHNVIIKESYEGHHGTLGRAKLISASFRPMDILQKNYTIKEIYLENAEVNLKLDRQGNPNYLFVKKKDGAGGSTFSLPGITAENVQFDYYDQRSSTHIAGILKKGKARLLQIDTLLNVTVEGSLLSDEIKTGKRTFFDNKEIDILTQLTVNLPARRYHIQTANVRVDNGEFALVGEIDMQKKSIDLDVRGLRTTFQSIISLLSGDLAKHFRTYRSRGDTYFTASVSGGFDQNQSPTTSISFGTSNASFYHPEYKKEITDVNVEGHFRTSKSGRLEDYHLDLQNFSCMLEDRRLEGSLSIMNFKDQHIDLKLKGEADVNTLLMLFPRSYVKTAFGNIALDVHLNGKIKDPRLTRSLHASGKVNLRNVSFVLNGEKLPFNKINGSLMLQNNDLAVSKLKGYVGKSDFELNGFIKDISGILFTKNKLYRMQADLQSDYIDFDELLKSNFASRDTSINKQNAYRFRINPNISLDFNCQIKHLKFRRFHGRSVRGNVDIHNRIAQLNNVSFHSMGGSVELSGAVTNKQQNMVESISDASLHGINIDSAFYVFRNFNQNWLIDKNLKGQVHADINLYMNFDERLVLNSNSLRADISTSIENGELNDFEPMMRLSKFVEEESLAEMRFSRMTNQIRIENRTIYLPEMEIRSNVSNILVRGTHTFDREIDYHVSVPMKSFLRFAIKSDYDESARSGMNLLLKITGTTSDYRISFDSRALKEKIVKDVLDEGQEWKDLRNKGAIEEETPELEDEYFDFEETETQPSDQ